MDQLPNYQNVALRALPEGMGQAPPVANPVNNQYISARDRRLADREAKRRDRKQQQNVNKQEDYLRSLQEPPAPAAAPAAPDVPGFGALSLAAAPSSNPAPSNNRMNSALARASEMKSRRDQAYEEKKRAFAQKKLESQGAPPMRENVPPPQMQMQMQMRMQQQPESNNNDGGSPWAQAKMQARENNQVAPSRLAVKPLNVQAAPAPLSPRLNVNQEAIARAEQAGFEEQMRQAKLKAEEQQMIQDQMMRRQQQQQQQQQQQRQQQNPVDPNDFDRRQKALKQQEYKRQLEAQMKEMKMSIRHPNQNQDQMQMQARQRSRSPSPPPQGGPTYLQRQARENQMKKQSYADQLKQQMAEDNRRKEEQKERRRSPSPPRFEGRANQQQMSKQQYAEELRQQMAQKEQKQMNRNPPAFNPEVTDGFGSNQDKRQAQLQKQQYAQQLREQMRQDQQRGQPMQQQQQQQQQAAPPQQSNVSYEEQERLAKVAKQHQYAEQLERQIHDVPKPLRRDFPLDQVNNPHHLHTQQDDGFGSNQDRKEKHAQKLEYAKQLRQQMMQNNPNGNNNNSNMSNEADLRSTWGNDKWENKRVVPKLDPRTYGDQLRQQMQEQEAAKRQPIQSISEQQPNEYHRAPLSPKSAAAQRANIQYKLQLDRDLEEKRKIQQQQRNQSSPYSRPPEQQQHERAPPTEDFQPHSVLSEIGHHDRTGAVTPRNRAGGHSVMTMHGGAPSQQKIDHDRHRRDEYRRVLEAQIQEKKDRELRSREAREGNSSEPLPWQRQAQPQHQQLEDGFEIGPMGLPVRKSPPVKRSGSNSPRRGGGSRSHSPSGASRAHAYMDAPNPHTDISAHYDPDKKDSAHARHLFSDPLKAAQEDRDNERKAHEANYRHQIEDQIRQKEEEKRRAKEHEEDVERKEEQRLRQEQEELQRRFEEEEKAKAEAEAAAMQKQLEKDAEEHRRGKELEKQREAELELKAELKAKREIEEMNRQLELEKASVQSQHQPQMPPSQLHSPLHSQPPSQPSTSRSHLFGDGSEIPTSLPSFPLDEPDPRPPAHPSARGRPPRRSQHQQQMQQQPLHQPFAPKPLQVNEYDPDRLPTVRDESPNSLQELRVVSSEQQQQPQSTNSNQPNPLGTTLRSEFGQNLQQQIKELQEAQKQQMMIQQQLMMQQLGIQPPSVVRSVPAQPPSLSPLKQSVDTLNTTATSLGPRLDTNSTMVVDWDNTPFATPRAQLSEVAENESPISSSGSSSKKSGRSKKSDKSRHSKKSISKSSSKKSLPPTSVAASVDSADASDSEDADQKSVKSRHSKKSISKSSSKKSLPPTSVAASVDSADAADSDGADQPASPLQPQHHSYSSASSASSPSSSPSQRNRERAERLAANRKKFELNLPKSSSVKSLPADDMKHKFEVGDIHGLDLHGHSPSPTKSKSKSKSDRKQRRSVGGMKFSPHPQPEASSSEEEERQRHHLKHDVGDIHGLDLHGHSPSRSKSKSPSKSDRKRRKSVGGMKFSKHPQPQPEEVEEEKERQRYHMKHDVGDIHGLDLHGHSPSPTRGRSRLPRRKSATPKFTPHPNKAQLKENRPSTPTPSPRYHRRHDVGHIDGLDLHGHSPSRSPSRSVSPSKSPLRRRNSAKPTFTPHPLKKKQELETISPVRGQYDRNYEVGRMDGLDLHGYSSNDSAEVIVVEPQPKRSLNRRNSAKPTFTSPPRKTPKPTSDLQSLLFGAAEANDDSSKHRGKYDRRFDVGRMDGLDLQGYESSSSIEVVSPSTQAKKLTRQKSAKANLASPQRKAQNKPSSPSPSRAKYSMKYDVGRIDGLDLVGESVERRKPTSKSDRPPSAKPTFTSPKRTSEVETISDSDEELSNKFSQKYEVGRMDALNISGYDSRYAKKEKKQKKSSEARTLKRAGSAKSSLTSPPARVTFADEEAPISATEKYSRKFNVGRVDAILDGDRKEYFPDSSSKNSSSPRRRSAKATFSSPNPKNIQTQHTENQILETLLFGEVDTSAPPQMLKEKLDFAADRVASARSKMKESQRLVEETKNISKAQILAANLANDASLNAQVAIAKKKYMQDLQAEREKSEGRIGQLQAEAEEKISEITEEADRRQREIDSWVGKLEAEKRAKQEQALKNMRKMVGLMSGKVLKTTFKAWESFVTMRKESRRQKAELKEELKLASEESLRVQQLKEEEIERVKTESSQHQGEIQAKLNEQVLRAQSEMLVLKTMADVELEAVKRAHALDLQRAKESRERAVNAVKEEGEQNLQRMIDEMKAVNIQQEAEFQRALESREKAVKRSEEASRHAVEKSKEEAASKLKAFEANAEAERKEILMQAAQDRAGNVMKRAILTKQNQREKEILLKEAQRAQEEAEKARADADQAEIDAERKAKESELAANAKIEATTLAMQREAEVRFAEKEAESEAIMKSELKRLATEHSLELDRLAKEKDIAADAAVRKLEEEKEAIVKQQEADREAEKASIESERAAVQAAMMLKKAMFSRAGFKEREVLKKKAEEAQKQAEEAQLIAEQTKSDADQRHLELEKASQEQVEAAKLAASLIAEEQRVELEAKLRTQEEIAAKSEKERLSIISSHEQDKALLEQRLTEKEKLAEDIRLEAEERVRQKQEELMERIREQDLSHIQLVDGLKKEKEEAALEALRIQQEEHEATLKKNIAKAEAEKAKITAEKAKVKADSMMRKFLVSKTSTKEKNALKRLAEQAEEAAFESKRNAEKTKEEALRRAIELEEVSKEKIAAAERAVRLEAEEEVERHRREMESKHEALAVEKDLAHEDALKRAAEEHEAKLNQREAEASAEKARLESEKKTIRAQMMMKKAILSRSTKKEREKAEALARDAEQIAKEAREEAKQRIEEAEKRQIEAETASKEKIAAAELAARLEAEEKVERHRAELEQKMKAQEDEHASILSKVRKDKEKAVELANKKLEEEKALMIENREVEKQAEKASIESERAAVQAAMMMKKAMFSRAGFREREALKKKAEEAEKLAEEAKLLAELTKVEAEQKQRELERISLEKIEAAQAASNKEAEAAKIEAERIKNEMSSLTVKHNRDLENATRVAHERLLEENVAYREQQEAAEKKYSADVALVKGKELVTTLFQQAEHNVITEAMKNELRVAKDDVRQLEAEAKMFRIIADEKEQALELAAASSAAAIKSEENLKDEMERRLKEQEKFLLDSARDKLDKELSEQKTFLLNSARENLSRELSEQKNFLLNSAREEKTSLEASLHEKFDVEMKLKEKHLMEELFEEKQRSVTVQSELTAKYDVLQASLDDVTRQKQEQAMKNTQRLIGMMTGKALHSTFKAWVAFVRERRQIKKQHEQAMKRAQKMIHMIHGKALTTTFMAWRIFARDQIEDREKREQFDQQLQMRIAAKDEELKLSLKSAVENAEARAAQTLANLERKQEAEDRARRSKERADKEEADGKIRMVLAQNKAEGLIQRAMLGRAGTLEKQRMKNEVQSARSEMEELRLELDRVAAVADEKARRLERAEEEANQAAKENRLHQQNFKKELLEAQHKTEIAKVQAMESLLGERRAHTEALESARAEMSSKYELLRGNLDEVTKAKQDLAMRNSQKMIRMMKGNTLSTAFVSWKMIGISENKLLSTTFIAWRMWTKEVIDERTRSVRFAKTLQREAAAAMERTQMKVLDTEKAAAAKLKALEEEYKEAVLLTQREAKEAVDRMNFERQIAEEEAKKLQDDQRQRYSEELERQRVEHERGLETARSQLEESFEATLQEITSAKDQAAQEALLKKDAEYRAILQQKEADATFAETVMKQTLTKSKAENLLKRAMSARANSLQQKKLLEQSKEAERAVELANLAVAKTKREAEDCLREVEVAAQERLAAAVRQAEVKAEEMLQLSLHKSKVESEALLRKQLADREVAENKMRMNLAQSKAEGLIQRVLVQRVGKLEKERMEKEVEEAKVEVKKVEERYSEAVRVASNKAKLLEEASKEAISAVKAEEDARIAVERQVEELKLEVEKKELELETARSEFMTEAEQKIEAVRVEANEALKKRRMSFDAKQQIGLQAMNVARVETEELKRRIEELSAEKEREVRAAEQVLVEERARLEEERRAELERVRDEMKRDHENEMSQIIYDRERRQKEALDTLTQEHEQRMGHQRAEIALRSAQQKEELSRVKAQELMKRVMIAKSGNENVEQIKKDYDRALEEMEELGKEVKRTKQEAGEELKRLRAAKKEAEEAAQNELESLRTEGAEKMKNLMSLHELELTSVRKENELAADEAVESAKREVASRMKMEMDKKESERALKHANMLMKRAMLNKANKLEQMKMLETARLAEQEYEKKLKVTEESRKELEFAVKEAKRTAEESIARDRELNETNLKHAIETIEEKHRSSLEEVQRQNEAVAKRALETAKVEAQARLDAEVFLMQAGNAKTRAEALMRRFLVGKKKGMEMERLKREVMVAEQEMKERVRAAEEAKVNVELQSQAAKVAADQQLKAENEIAAKRIRILEIKAEEERKVFEKRLSDSVKEASEATRREVEGKLAETIAVERAAAARVRAKMLMKRAMSSWAKDGELRNAKAEAAQAQIDLDREVQKMELAKIEQEKKVAERVAAVEKKVAASEMLLKSQQNEAQVELERVRADHAKELTLLRKETEAVKAKSDENERKYMDISTQETEAREELQNALELLNEAKKKEVVEKGRRGEALRKILRLSAKAAVSDARDEDNKKEVAKEIKRLAKAKQNLQVDGDKAAAVITMLEGNVKEALNVAEVAKVNMAKQLAEKEESAERAIESERKTIRMQHDMQLARLKDELEIEREAQAEYERKLEEAAAMAAAESAARLNEAVENEKKVFEEKQAKLKEEVDAKLTVMSATHEAAMLKKHQEVEAAAKALAETRLKEMLERTKMESGFEEEKKKWSEELEVIKKEKFLMSEKIKEVEEAAVQAIKDHENKSLEVETLNKMHLEQQNKLWSEKLAGVEEELKKNRAEAEKEVRAMEQKLLNLEEEAEARLVKIKAENGLELKRMHLASAKAHEESMIAEAARNEAQIELVKMNMEMKIKQTNAANNQELDLARQNLKEARSNALRFAEEARAAHEDELRAQMEESEGKMRAVEIENSLKIEHARALAEKMHAEKLRNALDAYETKVKTTKELIIAEERKRRDLEEEQKEVERTKLEADASKKIVMAARKSIGKLIRRANKQGGQDEEVAKLKAELDRLEGEAEADEKRREVEQQRMLDKESEIAKLHSKVEVAEVARSEAEKKLNKAREEVEGDVADRLESSGAAQIIIEDEILRDRELEEVDSREQERELKAKIEVVKAEEANAARRLEIAQDDVSDLKEKVKEAEGEGKELDEKIELELKDAKAIADKTRRVLEEKSSQMRVLGQQRRNKRRSSFSKFMDSKSAKLRLQEAGLISGRTSPVNTDRNFAQEQQAMWRKRAADVEIAFEAKMEKMKNEMNELVNGQLRQKEKEMQERLKLEQAQAQAAVLQREEASKSRAREEGKKRLTKMIQRAAWEKGKDNVVIQLLNQKEQLENETETMKTAISESKVEVRKLMSEMERREKEKEKQIEEVKSLMKLEKERWIEARKVEEIERMRGELAEEHLREVATAMEGLNGLKNEHQERLQALEIAEADAERRRLELEKKEDEVILLERQLNSEIGLNDLKRKEIEMRLLTGKAEVTEKSMQLEEELKQVDDLSLIADGVVEKKIAAEMRVAEAKTAVADDIVDESIGLANRQVLAEAEKMTEEFAEASRERRDVEERLELVGEKEEVLVGQKEQFEDQIVDAEKRVKEVQDMLEGVRGDEEENLALINALRERIIVEEGKVLAAMRSQQGVVAEIEARHAEVVQLMREEEDKRERERIAENKAMEALHVSELARVKEEAKIAETRRKDALRAQIAKASEEAEEASRKLKRKETDVTHQKILGRTAGVAVVDAVGSAIANFTKEKLVRNLQERLKGVEQELKKKEMERVRAEEDARVKHDEVNELKKESAKKLEQKRAEIENFERETREKELNNVRSEAREMVEGSRREVDHLKDMLLEKATKIEELMIGKEQVEAREEKLVTGNELAGISDVIASVVKQEVMQIKSVYEREIEERRTEAAESKEQFKAAIEEMRQMQLVERAHHKRWLESGMEEEDGKSGDLVDESRGDDEELTVLKEKEDKLRVAGHDLVAAESDAIVANGKVAMMGGGRAGVNQVEEAKLDNEIAEAKLAEARLKVQSLEKNVEDAKIGVLSRQASLKTFEKAVEVVDAATGMSRQGSWAGVGVGVGAGGGMSRQPSRIGGLGLGSRASSLATVGAGVSSGVGTNVGTGVDVVEQASTDLRELKILREELAKLKHDNESAKAMRKKAEKNAQEVKEKLERVELEHAVLGSAIHAGKGGGETQNKAELMEVNIAQAKLRQEHMELQRVLEQQRQKSKELADNLRQAQFVNNEVLERLSKKDERVINIEEELAKGLAAVMEKGMGMIPSPAKEVVREREEREEVALDPLRDNWMQKLDDKMDQVATTLSDKRDNEMAEVKRREAERDERIANMERIAMEQQRMNLDLKNIVAQKEKNAVQENMERIAMEQQRMNLDLKSIAAQKENNAVQDEHNVMNDELSAVSARLKELEEERAEKQRADAERKRRQEVEREEERRKRAAEEMDLAQRREEERRQFEDELRARREEDERARREKAEEEENKKRRLIEEQRAREEAERRAEEDKRAGEMEKARNEALARRKQQEEEEAEKKRVEEKLEEEKRRLEAAKKKAENDQRPFWQKLVAGENDGGGGGGGDSGGDHDSLYLLPKAVLDLEHALNNAGGVGEDVEAQDDKGGKVIELKHGSSFVNFGDDIFAAVNMTDEMMASSGGANDVGRVSLGKFEKAVKAPEVTSLDDSASEDSLDSLDIELLHSKNLQKYEKHLGDKEKHVELDEGEDAAFFSAPRYLPSSGISSRASSRESSRSNLGAQGYSAIYNNRKR
ncbi:hypothetical protein TrVE_jg10319 [Triparma verrucosa]|uniref:Uncharacterized protein n=1 Tax=Triparma verrucosa TaxID=1606542 RepID=A0A9W7BVA3_9STRA|nr:hypothetical protein TrVE_jg10319 [Triparma verrucosa]